MREAIEVDSQLQIDVDRSEDFGISYFFPNTLKATKTNLDIFNTPIKKHFSQIVGSCFIQVWNERR